MTTTESQTRILVADDDEDILNLVALTLEREGYAVIRARDGAEAVDVALHAQPDLLVLDVMMPKQDGFAVIRALRGEISTETTPILLLTASAASTRAPTPSSASRSARGSSSARSAGSSTCAVPSCARRAGRPAGTRR